MSGLFGSKSSRAKKKTKKSFLAYPKSAQSKLITMGGSTMGSLGSGEPIMDMKISFLAFLYQRRSVAQMIISLS